MLRDLALEAVSGTPGTSASLTVTAVTSPFASPRLSDVANPGVMFRYTIEASDGQALALGIGYSSAAGTFVRVQETAHYDGTTFTKDPSTLYSLPTGCTIYASASSVSIVPSLSQPISIDADKWVEPGGKEVAASTCTMTAQDRDHFFRLFNACGFKVDAIGFYAGAVGVIDVGLYAVNATDGSVGTLLLGWQGVTTASGNNILTLASATLGVLPKAAQRLPLGDLWAMLNVSSTTVTFNRTVQGNTSVGAALYLASAAVFMYAGRTNATAFASNPTLAGRHTNGVARLPMLAFRGA